MRIVLPLPPAASCTCSGSRSCALRVIVARQAPFSALKTADGSKRARIVPKLTKMGYRSYTELVIYGERSTRQPAVASHPEQWPHGSLVRHSPPTDASKRQRLGLVGTARR